MESKEYQANLIDLADALPRYLPIGMWDLESDCGTQDKNYQALRNEMELLTAKLFWELGVL